LSFRAFKRFFYFFLKSRKVDSRNKQIDFSKLSAALGVEISNIEYFAKALTHKSYIDVNPSFSKSNERLEFLGDSILGFVVAENLFVNFPDKDEGFLTKYRAGIVDKPALFKAAEKIGLLDFVLFDRRFVKGSDEGLKTISADCMEAIIGAIYIDRGFEEVKKFILAKIIKPSFDSMEFKFDKNFKGQLLEFTHAHHLSAPFYKVVDEYGPDHNKKFEVDVIINNEIAGHGIGRNKKSAEQEAAKIALERFTHN